MMKGMRWGMTEHADLMRNGSEKAVYSALANLWTGAQVEQGAKVVVA